MKRFLGIGSVALALLTACAGPNVIVDNPSTQAADNADAIAAIDNFAFALGAVRRNYITRLDTSQLLILGLRGIEQQPSLDTTAVQEIIQPAIA